MTHLVTAITWARVLNQSAGLLKRNRAFVLGSDGSKPHLSPRGKTGVPRTATQSMGGKPLPTLTQLLINPILDDASDYNLNLNLNQQQRMH